MRRHFLAILLIISNHSFSQVGGKNVYSFLNTPTSARQIALGGKTLTLLDNVNQPIWNPASINLAIDRKLSVNYTSYLANISVGSISYAYRFNRHSNPIHTNISYFNYGSIINTDEEGKETGTFNASDISISIGYAIKIPNSNFYAGANIRFINSSIANFSSSGISSDFGVMYYTNKKPYVFTLVARNIGTQINSFNGTYEHLPFELAISGSYRLQNVPLRWYATIDNLQKWQVGVTNPSNNKTDLEGNITKEEISFLDNTFRHLVIGAELFPKSAVNLRIGYNFRRGKELKLQNVRTFGGLSFGFGLKLNKIKINYAYSEYHSASNTSTFSLEIDLHRRKRRRIPTKY